METDVALPSPAVDFNFDSACTSPYVSCPSSPQRFGNFFFSAPTSPTRASSFSREFNSFSRAGSRGGSLSTIPFNWEEKPGIPKAKDNTGGGDDENDFEFDFGGGQFERTSLSADELFDGGKIKPLKPPPGLKLQVNSENGLIDSPKSPRKFFREALSPRSKKKDFDPFEAAIEQSRREKNPPQDDRNEQKQQQNPERSGRQRFNNSSSASNIGHNKGTRSLSPFRVRDIFFESESNQQSSNSSTSSKPETKQTSSLSSSLSLFSTSSWRGYKKWNLKDLLLFRSASEGRATSKDQLKKYSLLKKSGGEDDAKNSSFRSTESGGGSVSLRRRGTASAHERHYTANRAVSEEMRRKTFLPYNHGLLGCLGFNPAVQDISRGLGSLTRG